MPPSESRAQHRMQWFPLSDTNTNVNLLTSALKSPLKSPLLLKFKSPLKSLLKSPLKSLQSFRRDESKSCPLFFVFIFSRGEETRSSAHMPLGNEKDADDTWPST
mmetsp:Transcript_8840/g.17327  ORF Transcript_8840/g.17327 Transcript_8840/m.17327 type:complete len:105 (-) Transcript_8840:202-516(-)